METPRIKRGTKLPRGSFFYIQVGHRFYGGEEAEIREVKLSESSGPRKREKGESYGVWAARRWGVNDGFMRGGRAKRDRLKKSQASYLSNGRRSRDKAPAATTRELTGVRTSRLVEEAQKAKRYRTREQVDSACERLASVYGSLGVKITILYQGELQ